MIRPITRKDARALVAKWHSHHTAHVGETLSLGWHDGGSWLACVVMGRPSRGKNAAPAIDLVEAA